MEEEFLNAMLMRRATKKRVILQKRRTLKRLRTENDPFDTTEKSFQKDFRLPRNLCAALISELEPHDTQPSDISFQTRFLAALHFFGYGSYQQSVGNAFGTAMSQPSVSRTIHAISKLIIEHKGREVRFPQEQAALKLGFYQKFGIKGTLGALDCTHVAIMTPSSSDTENPVSLYMNRKTFYSVNVEAICDHRMIFSSINAKFPGSCHDSGIWTTSPARNWFLNNHCPRQSTWLLGDKGYPLKPWLFTPFVSPHTAKERKFNEIHAKARNTIERAFGVLKGRFKCISIERKLYYSHARAANIIYALAILHNILIKNGIELDPSEEELDEASDDPDTASLDEASASATTLFREGTRLRASYVSTL